MPVQDKHKDYEKSFYKWQLVRHVCEGSQAVKHAKRIDGATATALGSEPGTLYLPAPNPTDNSIENRERYRAYRERANFVNFTGHTKDALAGMVWRKEAMIELPPAMEGILYNANGKGESLESLMKRSLDEVVMTGREGILVDYPVMPDSVTLAESANVLPFLKLYHAETIINWQEEYINGECKYTCIVLKEEKQVYQDEFSFECKDQYRALMLNEQGYYIQRLYNEDGELLGVENENGDFITDILILDGNGAPFDEIQFFFAGAMNNDARPDKSPLYDMAEINISHYRNSADYEESCFIVGQPTPVLTGLTQSWIDDVFKGQIELGSRAAITLPEGGSAMLLQASPNQMPSEGMIMKQQQMIQIGAKIITDSGQAETAEAAKIRFAGQNSKLATIVSNLEEAFENALYSAMRFMGIEGEIELELNKEFYDKQVDPNLLMAKIQLFDRGIIATSDVREHLKKMGELDEDRDDALIDDEVRDISPFSGSLNVNL